MSGKSGIEWTDATWNPTKGCDRVSAGCDHCYAMTMAKRLKGMGSAEYQQDGDPRTSGPGFLAHEAPGELAWPLRKTKPLRIFVNSMSDLFHDNISDGYIAKVFAVMAAARQHTFQVLTKRHGRMRSLLSSYDFREQVFTATNLDTGETHGDNWPLRNVWLGVSVESQQWADIRIPNLLDTPAAVRFLSCEPLLGPVDLVRSINQEPLAAYHFQPGGIDWVIVGGESGRGARPMHPDWARTLRDQCVAAGVPFLFKQWGEWAPSEPGADPRRVVRKVWLRADGSYEHLGDLDPVGVCLTTELDRVGKKAAGRELDGRTWDEYPAVADA